MFHKPGLSAVNCAISQSIGGGASGQFIDSDKFKESDINFFVQVKVVNQATVDRDCTEFQNILKPGVRFTEVYGDTFISGFEEGGELNALISVKLSDKNKTFAVRAQLEARLGTPALSGEIKGGVEIDKAEIKGCTETTVTVNWSGGGRIKPANAIWDVNSLTLAASNFPDHVAKTPQKTYAILSKYTSLKSFLAIYQPTSVLTYENAGVYTSFLLDMYMDYNLIWKQIQLAGYELRNRRADIKTAKASEEVEELARELNASRQAQPVKPEILPKKPARGITVPAVPVHQESGNEGPPATVATTDDDTKTSVTEVADTVHSGEGEEVPTPASSLASGNSDNTDRPGTDIEIPSLIEYVPYPATILGLDRARRDCRNEMIKIVSEVDIITTYPELALDYRRESKFVSPRIFTQLLPIVTLRAVETSKPELNLNPQNLIILGETNEAPQLQQWLYEDKGISEQQG